MNRFGLILILNYCILLSANAAVKNSFIHFPFKNGSIKIINYNGIHPDTLVFNNVKVDDRINFQLESKNSDPHIFFAIVLSSTIGEYSMSFYSVHDNSENEFVYKKDRVELLKTNNDYNQQYYEMFTRLDSLYPANMNKAILSILPYKGQDVYFFINTLMLPQLKDKYPHYLDSVYQLAINNKSSYWKNAFIENYLILKNVNAGIFNQTEMLLLDRKLTDRNLLSYLDSTKQNTVYIWASWCAPCIEKLQSISHKMDSINQRTNLILVSIDEDDAKWQKACEKLSFPFNHYKAKNTSVFQKKLLIHSIPLSMDIDKQTQKIERSEF